MFNAIMSTLHIEKLLPPRVKPVLMAPRPLGTNGPVGPPLATKESRHKAKQEAEEERKKETEEQKQVKQVDPSERVTEELTYDPVVAPEEEALPAREQEPTGEEGEEEKAEDAPQEEEEPEQAFEPSLPTDGLDHVGSIPQQQQQQPEAYMPPRTSRPPQKMHVQDKSTSKPLPKSKPKPKPTKAVRHSRHPMQLRGVYANLKNDQRPKAFRRGTGSASIPRSDNMTGVVWRAMNEAFVQEACHYAAIQAMGNKTQTVTGDIAVHAFDLMGVKVYHGGDFAHGAAKRALDKKNAKKGRESK